MKKYSLWLCPPEASEAFAKLDTLLSDASTSLGTERFAPHATLFSPVQAGTDEEAVAQARRYAATLAPGGISVAISALATGGKYYQCIILEARSSDSLVAANSAARQYWSTHGQPRFYPHVSVVYSDLAGEQLTKATSVVHSMLPEDLQDLSFVATDIHVINTDGSCAQWRTVGKVPIS